MRKRSLNLLVSFTLALACNSLASADSGLRSENGAVVLRGGQVLPVYASQLQDSAEQVVLGRGRLGEVASGRSQTAGGLVLSAGTLKVPEPHSGLLGVAAGIGLLVLAQYRRSTSPVIKEVS